MEGGKKPCHEWSRLLAAETGWGGGDLTFFVHVTQTGGAGSLQSGDSGTSHHLTYDVPVPSLVIPPK